MINFLFKKVYKKVSKLLPLVRYCAYIFIPFPIIAQKKITRKKITRTNPNFSLKNLINKFC